MSEPLFHIVLVAPEIPQNTGNIGRICACTGCLLHLVKPIGFELDDRHVRRSGMDYWRKIEYRIHENWQDFLAAKGEAPMYLYSTKAKQSYWDAPMEDGAYLVFGSEGHGLPQEIHDGFQPFFYTIPMPGNFSRSLNLANSTAVVIYEGLRRRLHKGGIC